MVSFNCLYILQKTTKLFLVVGWTEEIKYREKKEKEKIAVAVFALGLCLVC